MRTLSYIFENRDPVRSSPAVHYFSTALSWTQHRFCVNLSHVLHQGQRSNWYLECGLCEVC